MKTFYSLFVKFIDFDVQNTSLKANQLKKEKRILKYFIISNRSSSFTGLFYNAQETLNEMFAPPLIYFNLYFSDSEILKLFSLT